MEIATDVLGWLIGMLLLVFFFSTAMSLHYYYTILLLCKCAVTCFAALNLIKWWIKFFSINVLASLSSWMAVIQLLILLLLYLHRKFSKINIEMTQREKKESIWFFCFVFCCHCHGFNRQTIKWLMRKLVRMSHLENPGLRLKMPWWFDSIRCWLYSKLNKTSSYKSIAFGCAECTLHTL